MKLKTSNTTKSATDKKTRGIAGGISKGISSLANPLRNTKIQMRLIVSFTLISIITLGTTGILAYKKSSEAITKKIQSYSSQMIGQFSSISQTHLGKYDSSLMDLALSREIRYGIADLETGDSMQDVRITSNISQQMFSKFLSTPEVLSADIFKIGSDAVISYNPGPMSKNKELKDKYINLLSESGSSVIWAYYKATEDNSFTDCIILGRKIASYYSAKDIGYIFAYLKPSAMESVLKNINFGEGSEITLLTQDGFVISGSSPELFGTEFKEKSIMQNLISGESETFQYTINNKDCLIAHSYIQSAGWYAIASIPYDYINADPNTIKNFIVMFFVVSMLVSIILSFIIAKSISIPLSSLSNFMSEAKNGNLAIAVKDNSRDEIGEVIGNFNQMLQNIRSLISKVQASTHRVLSSSEKIAASSQRSFAASEQISLTIQEIARGASDQASEIAQGMEHMGRLSDGINKVSSDAGNVSSVVDNTRSLSKGALDTVKILNDKAQDTKAVTSKIVVDINSLNDDMKEIKKIVKLIADISEQTNLLSLNAAIEAARAGEAGRGFAVVADEVKKLAEQSKDASVTINRILNTIQHKSELTAEEANSASDIIQQQSEAVSQTDESFKTILYAMEGISEQIRHMEGSVEEISIFRQKTLSTIENVSAVSEQSAATAQEVSASTQEQIAGTEELAALAKDLNVMSQELDTAISQFKI
ncbi:methyl-accepting chemotaxis sensory transducer with Cache sensor [Anaerobacterium chartisolvens]|uniref:Methyl-accepting chemotaxis sensory transducer with Cache sensor n=1 Tax=Anaerobacterium chartisolvens TaxID=1297424 RepID=A0A369BBT4_9FIRM|nr:methyl-accepting chemotaxis protein [Anaerobacterium chartisolvens]RCX18871.1 methyl-accepting chemotaxis sensory transducer with Cache sensor [Anaerobacterium chartisolvens]